MAMAAKVVAINIAGIDRRYVKTWNLIIRALFLNGGIFFRNWIAYVKAVSN